MRRQRLERRQADRERVVPVQNRMPALLGPPRAGEGDALGQGIVVAEQGRVALGDEIGAALQADAVAVLIGERQLECDAIVRARDFGDVPLAGEVLRQFDAAGSDLKRLSSGQYELRVAAQGDHILAA